MLRITADTNTLISAVIAKGNEFELLQSVRSGKIKLALSYKILEEFLDVISRPKFGFSEKQITDVLKQLITICNIVIPDVKINEIKEDPDDNIVLECALTAKVNYIIFGDEHLLKLKKYKDIKILRTNEFLRLY